MYRYIITAESGSDISFVEAEALGVEIISMHVTMGGESRDDGRFPVEEVCAYYDSHHELPKTSGCSPEDFVLFFDRVRRSHPGCHILHLAYSAVTTVSYQSARIAAEGQNDITILDTRHVSAGQRAVVLQMRVLLQQEPELTPDELADRLEPIINRTRMCFVPADLKYLHAGGRCGNLAFIGGQLLKLHPRVEIKGGRLIATKKYRGSFEKVIPALIHDYTAENDLSREKLCFVYGVGLSDLLKRLAEKTAHACGYRAVEWVQTGCVITTHGGPGAFGMVGIAEG